MLAASAHSYLRFRTLHRLAFPISSRYEIRRLLTRRNDEKIAGIVYESKENSVYVHEYGVRLMLR